MTFKIDLRALSVETASALALHYSELCDIQSAANNALAVNLDTILADCPPASAHQVRDTMNEWSTFLNAAVAKSDAEVRRILGAENSSPSTLQ